MSLSLILFSEHIDLKKSCIFLRKISSLPESMMRVVCLGEASKSKDLDG